MNLHPLAGCRAIEPRELVAGAASPAAVHDGESVRQILSHGRRGIDGAQIAIAGILGAGAVDAARIADGVVVFVADLE